MDALVRALREGPALLTVSRDGQQFNVKVDARPVSEKTLLDVYGRFNLIHDWDGKNVVQVADYRFSEDASSLRYELGAGMNFSLNEGASEAYFDIATQLGSKIRYPWEINVGLMFNF